ncbi:MAG: putative toxin-antitoxin system toxin component, PIN family [Luteimonas sp.]
MSHPPRVVLDTNVVLSALVFGGGRAARVRRVWRDGICAPLVSTATVQELIRVLAYPKFRLSAEDQEHLLADYLPWATTVAIPARPPATPPCRDPFDLPFLQLAAAGRASMLVTGDQDLLSLGDQSRYRILTPADFFTSL